MIKKILIGIAVALLAVLVFVFFFIRSSSGFRSIYLVPENAVLLVETKDPIKAWDKIVHSKAWAHLSSNKKLSELNEEIISADSVVNSSRFLMKLLGKKPVLISQHPVSRNKYDILYIVEIGKISRYKNPEKLIKSTLGKNFEVTSRRYKDYKVIEILNLKEGDYYFLSFLKGKLIFSFDTKLIEASIDASEKMLVGRNRAFTSVYSKAGSSGILSIYINHNNLGPFIKTLSPDSKKSFFENEQFLFTGINFDINTEGLIDIHGYTSINDTIQENYTRLFKEGSLEIESSTIIPQRLASLAKINFRNAHDYFHGSMKSFGDETYNSYINNIGKVEKKLKISLQKNFFSWMDKEIVLLQTQPSNLGRNNEFAAIIHSNDSAKASDNLHFIWKQIKKNTPVKVKNVRYKNYDIDYIAFPGLIKILFGESLKKIEKPYFSQIGENVIISNHPQTIKNLIDDYLEGSTLENSIDYYNFCKLFNSKAAMFTYFEPPVLFYNLQDFLSPQSWKELKKDKDYFTCFSQAGASISASNHLIHFNLQALYKPEEETYKKQYYNTYELVSLFSTPEKSAPIAPKNNVKKETDTIPKIIIHELDADKQEEFYEDGSLKYLIELKNGKKHGDYKEYYPNGKIKIKGNYDMDKPSGKWRYYDEEGELKKTDRY